MNLLTHSIWNINDYLYVCCSTLCCSLSDLADKILVYFDMDPEFCTRTSRT